MKKLFVLCIVAIFLLAGGCGKEPVFMIKEYPYIITDEPTISEKGAIFTGEIKEMGTQPIRSYGFVWGLNSNPTINDYYIQINDSAKVGVFSCEVNKWLNSGFNYYVRSFVRTDSYDVYGSERWFISHGSELPGNDMNN